MSEYICITHTKVSDMTDSQLSTPRALFFLSLFWNEAQNQLLLPNITDKSSPLPNQKSYRIESNLSPPKIHQKHRAYSRDRSIQTFLTRFPLTHDAFSSPFLSFSISQMLTSFPHLPHILAVLIYYTAHHQQQQYQLINRRVSFRSDQSGHSSDVPLHLQWINMLMA